MAKRGGRRTPFRKGLRAFTRGAERLRDADPDALHHMRVASRRLREWLPMLGLDLETSQDFGRRLRKVTKRLGTVRELDVSLQLVEGLSSVRRYSSTALQHVRAHLDGEQTAARKRLTTTVSVERLERLAARLRRATKKHLQSRDDEHRQCERPDRKPWVWAAEARVAHRAARVRAAIEVANRTYLPDRLHDVRVALKKLRYAVELLPDIRHRRTTTDVAALRTALDFLGRLHDLEVLIAHVRRLQVALSSVDLAMWHQLGWLARCLEIDCRRVHARYVKARTRLMAMTLRMSVAVGGPPQLVLCASARRVHA